MNDRYILMIVKISYRNSLKKHLIPSIYQRGRNEYNVDDKRCREGDNPKCTSWIRS